MSSDKLKKYRQKADKLWQKKFTKSHCEACWSTEGLVGHHFYFKGSHGHLRYAKDNCVTLCYDCHSKLHHQGKRKEIEEKIIGHRGQKWYKELKKKANEFPGHGWKNEDWFIKKFNELKKNE